MTNDFGCSYMLIGHSERRHIFMESEKFISNKISIALQKNKKVILCVGETLKDYRSNNTKQVITKQINSALKESLQLIKKNKKNLVIAYEPVWAIGTGRSAKIQDIETTHTLIRKLLFKLINDAKSEIKILYGGSVSPQNAKEILDAENVDGALVGGASLSAKKFIEICRTIWDKYTMQTVILIIHVLLAVALIVLILVQHGKGADAGAAFGSGASSTVFGARGSATFLTKLTTGIALIFFVTSISLAYIASNKTSESKSLIENNQRDIKAPSNTPDKDLP